MARHISKEEFCKIIKYLQRKDEADSAMNGIIWDYSDVYCDGIIPIDVGPTIIVNLLEENFELPIDDVYGSVLYWWIYDLNFGVGFEKKRLSYINENGEKVYPDISTVEKLYDYMIEEGKTKEAILVN